MSLKTGDTERQARISFLTDQTSIYKNRIKKVLNSISYGYTEKQLNELDDLYTTLNMIRAELDVLLIQSEDKDMFDEDISDYFRDDLCIDKIAVRGMD